MDAIYFDLDGTLTDPKPGITRSIQYALQRLDHHTIPTEDELTWCIGPPLRTSFVRLLGGDDSADRAVSLYRERFSDIGLYENRVYDGVVEVLTTEAGATDPAALCDLPIDALVEAQSRALVALLQPVGMMPFHPMIDGDVLPSAPVDACATSAPVEGSSSFTSAPDNRDASSPST